jgi:hypothetical protein
MESEFLTRGEAAKRLSARGFPCSVTTLETYGTRGGGPPFYKIGRRVLYRTSDVDSWLGAKMSGPFLSTSNCARSETDG